MMTDRNICAGREELIGKLVTMVKYFVANKQYLFIRALIYLVGKLPYTTTADVSIEYLMQTLFYFFPFFYKNDNSNGNNI